MTRISHTAAYALVILVVAAVISLAAGLVVREAELSTALRIVLKLLGVLSALTAAGAGLTLAVCLAALGWGHLSPALDKLAPKEEPQPKPRPAPPEAEQVTDLMTYIDKRLRVVEHRQANAGKELARINEQAGHLVRLIVQLMRRRKSMLDELAGLEEANAALAGGDTVAIARAAGRIRDNQVRSLMLAVNQEPDADYQLRLIEMVATRSGDLEGGAEQLKALALDWMTQVSDYRSRSERLRLAIHVADAVRPLAMLDARLLIAERCLSAADKPSVAALLRQSPAAPMLPGQ